MDGHLQVQQPQLVLPPGFRFHPTDEDIITSYLVPKVLNPTFITEMIGEVDLNKNEPWELPRKAKMGEKKWYFYCQKDHKYPTGIRTNWATKVGYWNATGKDKEILDPKSTLISMKKTLVVYKGRAPTREKTNWVMHEYRLEIGKQPTSSLSTDIAKAAIINASSKEEQVVCRIFHKSTGLKKLVMPSGETPMPMSMEAEQQQVFVDSGTLTPLMDYGVSSSMAPPLPLPNDSSYQLHATGAWSSLMGNAVLPVMNDHYFGNHLVQMMGDNPMSFYDHQQDMMQMSVEESFMVRVEPRSGPSSMVMQEDAMIGLSNNFQGNDAAPSANEISSVNMNMDGMWEYR